MDWTEKLQKNQIQIGRQNVKTSRLPLPEKTPKKDCNEELLNIHKKISAKMKTYVPKIFDVFNNALLPSLKHQDGSIDKLRPIVLSDSFLKNNYLKYEGSGYEYGVKVILTPDNHMNKLSEHLGLTMYCQFIPFEDEEIACKVLDWIKNTKDGVIDSDIWFGDNRKYHGAMDLDYERSGIADILIGIGPRSNDGSGAFIVYLRFNEYVNLAFRQVYTLLLGVKDDPKKIAEDWLNDFLSAVSDADIRAMAEELINIIRQ